MAAVKSIVREFTFERDTRNTRRFAEDESGTTAVGTLYVQSAALAELGSKPERVRVTIEAL